VVYRPVARQGPRSERDSGRCLIMAYEHVNNIWAIAIQPTITTIEELLGPVFSVASVPGLYNEDLRPAQGN
jgi:hypothetical protein